MDWFDKCGDDDEHVKDDEGDADDDDDDADDDDVAVIIIELHSRLDRRGTRRPNSTFWPHRMYLSRKIQGTQNVFKTYSNSFKTYLLFVTDAMDIVRGEIFVMWNFYHRQVI